MNPTAVTAPREARSADLANPRKLEVIHQTETLERQPKTPRLVHQVARSADQSANRAASGRDFRSRMGRAPMLKIPRLVHRQVDRLSSAAKDLMVEGIRERWPYDAISRAVQERTGEFIKGKTIGGFARAWRREELQRRALAEMIPGRLAALGWKAEEVVELVAGIDFSAGSHLRRRMKLFRALRAFLREPNCGTMRRLEAEALTFVLERKLLEKGGNRD